MVRIRCPSTVSSDSPPIVAAVHRISAKNERTINPPKSKPKAVKPKANKATSERAKAKVKSKGKQKLKRVRSGSVPPSASEMAARIARRDRITITQQNAFVFVGNLSPVVSVGEIYAHFAECGPIRHVVIRCGSGTVAPLASRDVTSRFYASVELLSKRQQKALSLHGTVLGGRKLVVCVNPGELPEASYIRKERQSTRLQLPGVPVRQPTLVGRRREVAVVKDVREEAAREKKKNQIMGYSFALTIS